MKTFKISQLDTRYLFDQKKDLYELSIRPMMLSQLSSVNVKSFIFSNTQLV